MAIYFYRANEKYGCFSNFSKHSFVYNQIFYKTSEHFFQAHKFLSKQDFEDVLNSKSAFEAATIGRDRSRSLRDDWEQVKMDIMYVGVYEKFKQNIDILEILRDSGSEEIIENTTDDMYWGCGYNGSGKNHLGKILMKVRKELS